MSSLHRGELEKIVLRTIAAAGILAVAVVAPNALQLLRFTKRKKNYPPIPTYRISRVTQRLLRKGLLTVQNTNGKRSFSVTPLGKKVLQVASLRAFAVRKRKHWDGKWRFLMFDIPEYRRGVRNRFRQELTAAGFRCFQQSIWVSPYPCDEFVELLKTDLRIWKNAICITSDGVANEQQLRALFSDIL